MVDGGHHARYLAHLANHTYHLNSRRSDVDGLHTQLQQMKLKLDANPGNPFYDLPSGHHGYIAVAADHAIIAIRGSGESDDWRNNLRFWQVTYGLGGQFMLALPPPHKALPRPFRLSYSGRRRFIKTKPSG